MICTDSQKQPVWPRLPCLCLTLLSGRAEKQGNMSDWDRYKKIIITKSMERSAIGEFQHLAGAQGVQQHQQMWKIRHYCVLSPTITLKITGYNGSFPMRFCRKYMNPLRLGQKFDSRPASSGSLGTGHELCSRCRAFWFMGESAMPSPPPHQCSILPQYRPPPASIPAGTTCSPTQAHVKPQG